MRVVSKLLKSKYADEDRCEDVIVTTNDFTAVFDGATNSPPSGTISGGLLAATAAAEALEQVPAQTDVRTAVDTLSAAVGAAAVPGAPWPLPPGEDRPSTTMLVYSHARHELWRVGDSGFRIDEFVDTPDKPIDQVTYGFRAAYLQALLAAGEDPAELLNNDPSLALLAPVLQAQRRLVNRQVPFGYGALDGARVPGMFVECIEVPANADMLVLATDGYPFILESLERTEEALQELARRDELGITDWPRPAGLSGPLQAFDDRAWVQLQLRN